MLHLESHKRQARSLALSEEQKPVRIYDLENNRWFLCVLAFICCLAWGAVCGVMLGITGHQVVVVSGSSMEPTYSDGDSIIMTVPSSVEELKGNPVCWVQLADGHDVIKRLIGYPGDTVELIDGDTYVNGKLLLKRSTSNWDNMSFTLSDNQFLFIGDNREDSMDGRFWSGNYVGFEQIHAYAPRSRLS